MNEKNKLKVALVHDFLNQFGGAEKTLESLCEIFPEAPIYTLIYEKEKMRGKFSDRKIRTSFLQKFPAFFRKRFQWLAPFFPMAPETFDLCDFDLVISSSGAWSKGIVARLNTLHIAYIHSPMRFVWDYNERYIQEKKSGVSLFLIRPIFCYFRLWDRLAADRPDFLIANSIYTQKRIKKYYRKESVVIYPPAWRRKDENIAGFSEKIKNKFPHQNFFLIVSRLSSYKKIDVAIETFNRMELPLVIIGEGKERKKMEKNAGKNITFFGWANEEELSFAYCHARAFIFPGIDDFGIAPEEAMRRGVPVIAIKKGGAKEIVEDLKTGIFFEVTTPEVLADGVRRFCENEEKFDKEYIKNKAQIFSEEVFKQKFLDYVKEVEEKFRFSNSITDKK